MLANGARLPYDRLVVSPGIDLKYDSVPGWSQAAEETDAARLEAGRADAAAEEAARRRAEWRRHRDDRAAEPLSLPARPL